MIQRPCRLPQGDTIAFVSLDNSKWSLLHRQPLPPGIHQRGVERRRERWEGTLAHARASTEGQVETWVGASFVLSLFVFDCHSCQ